MARKKVYFYRAYCGLNPAGEALPWHSGPALARIHALPFTDEGNYLTEGDEARLVCFVSRHDQLPNRLSLGRSRLGDLPKVELHGDLNDLDIPDDAGIAERTHVIVFKDNVVGMLYNHFAPRLSSLSHYLSKKDTEHSEGVRFDPLLRRDSLKALDRLGELRVVELRLRRSEIGQLREIDTDLAAALDGVAALGEAEQLEIVVRPAPHAREGIGRNWFRIVRRLLRSEHLPDKLERLVIQGRNATEGGLDTIDLLQDHVVSVEDIDIPRDGRSRAIPDVLAFRAIENAYGVMEEEIRLAAAVWRPT